MAKFFSKRRLKIAENKFGVKIHWYIMTSRANNEDTIYYGQNDNKLEIIGKVIYLWRNIGD